MELRSMSSLCQPEKDCSPGRGVVGGESGLDGVSRAAGWGVEGSEVSRAAGWGCRLMLAAEWGAMGSAGGKMPGQWLVRSGWGWEKESTRLREKD